MTTVILGFVFFICFIGWRMFLAGVRLENTKRTNDRLNRLETKYKALEGLYLDLNKKIK